MVCPKPLTGSVCISLYCIYNGLHLSISKPHQPNQKFLVDFNFFDLNWILSFAYHFGQSHDGSRTWPGNAENEELEDISYYLS